MLEDTWKPYIMRLALSAGIGGLLFGYDTGTNILHILCIQLCMLIFFIDSTGVISGALLYIKEDFESVEKKTWLQETIVSMAVAGAIIGAGVGGWMNDRFGRKISILVADFLFFVGAIIMALSPAPWMIILGRVFVGFGVGMASMTAPLYISESSPHRIRGALVKGNWRWMLGVAGVPAVVQFVLMLSLPESPRWLFRNGKEDEARSIIEKIYTSEEVEDELLALRISIEQDKANESSLGDGGMFGQLKNAWRNDVVRRGLYAGITVQVASNLLV
ncbi:UNVERIFIED_CONTAM: Inositol transporter 4 [Sesamum radiatum]|uniref:Inositol transporter 4 n=1 Tax=Sesamum radiatum TaxID=300843 RepID=A0AAW2SLI3_SESRA